MDVFPVRALPLIVCTLFKHNTKHSSPTESIISVFVSVYEILSATMSWIKCNGLLKTFKKHTLLCTISFKGKDYVNDYGQVQVTGDSRSAVLIPVTTFSDNLLDRMLQTSLEILKTRSLQNDSYQQKNAKKNSMQRNRNTKKKKTAVSYLRLFVTLLT